MTGAGGGLAGPIRWGIIGAGRVARDFAEGLRSLPEAELAAVASRTPATAAAFARLYAPGRIHASAEALVADPAVDVVYVATPNQRHAEECRLALAAGKPVLCEKPFALTADEARGVVDLARGRGLFCMEAMWTRCLPLVRRVAELVRAGAIGEPLLLTADFGDPVPYEPSGRFFDPAQGGGALLDRGVYAVSLASLLLGPPGSVQAGARLAPSGVDEGVAVLLGHPGGAQALLAASLRTRTPAEAVIMGSHGRLRIHAPFYCPERASLQRWAEPQPAGAAPERAGLRGRLVARARHSGALRRLYRRLRPLLGGEQTISLPIAGNGYNYEAAEVMRCLRAGLPESPLMPLDETVQIMATLDAIRAAWVAEPTAGG